MPNFNEQEYLEMFPDVQKAVLAGEFKSGYHHYKKFGKNEGRAPSGIAPRIQAVFHSINPNGLGLEIGASHNPIAPKRKGYNVHILDHLNAHDLRIKYADEAIDIDNIEEVDFVWNGEPLTEIIGNSNCYDWIIASHVIEHVPDLISFIQQCEQLLKPEGVLSLVVPDKRFCFDFFQPNSTTGMLLDAHFQKRVRTTPGQVFDHYVSNASSQKASAWSIDVKKIPNALKYNFSSAKSKWLEAVNSNKYMDVHCWRFTPCSFDLCFSDLNDLNLINMSITTQFPTHGCEFYVSLKKYPQSSSMHEGRLEFLHKIFEELRYPHT
jgi:2-polyprenyl-3-methyl-5-hydroxy-6-metoxy-1,4-benzoquinol methylase